MEENNYVVYKHTSPSGKVYIGITSRKPERRWDNGNGYKGSPKFYNAIQKYGWNNFKHEILFSGLNEISAKLIEEDLIYYYKSLNISYNITDGGDGSRGVSPSEETRKKLSERMKINNPMKDPDIRRKISNANKGKPSSRKGIARSEETKEKISKAKEKPVNQFSLDGKLIVTYKSMSEAEIYTGISNGNISKCCNGKQKTAGGFIWKFK